MILASRYSGNLELRVAAFGSSAIPPRTSGLAASGETVTLDTAVGLPAVLAAIRLVSETVGGLPLFVYQMGLEQRQPARDSWQWRLLHEQPNDTQSPFDLFADCAASIEATGNAYLQKAKSRRRVEALFLIDPARVQVVRDRDSGRKLFRVMLDRGGSAELDSGSILHLRGFTIAGGDVGLSPIAVARNSIGTALAQDRFGGAHYHNNARPGLAIMFPQGVTKEQADAWKADWSAEHGGAGNVGKPAVVGGGAQISPIPISLEDQQFVESQRFSVEQVARMWRLPSSMLGEALGMQQQGVADEAERFLKFSLAQRLRRIELGLRADPDLFPAGSGLFPEFVADGLLRGDTRARFEAYRAARQGGWVTPNEIRKWENLPPTEGGDEIQMTPVGGAPNPGRGEAEPEEEQED